MGPVREFFVTEAGECLDALEALIRDAAGPHVDVGEFLRLSRMLRGSAQMAREEHVRYAAQMLEGVARALASRTLVWGDDLRIRALATVADLRALVAIDAATPESARRIAGVRNRWPDPGIKAPPPPDLTIPEQEEIVTPGALAATPEFLAYAAREVSGTLAELNAALPVLIRQPRAREPLKKILRRQRALLGAAQLDAVPIVAETLRSIDSISRLVAARDASVVGDWLAAYTAARDVLAEAIGPLLEGRVPEHAPSAATLQGLRETLFSKYGTQEEKRPPQPVIADAPPIEVLNFFRGEARILLDRIDRMGRELGAAAPERQVALRRELITAMTALRDMADTFGFAETSVKAEQAIGRLSRSGAEEVSAWVERLRAAVEAHKVEEATHTEAEPETGADAPVPIQDLCYQGDAALRRALELRTVLENALQRGVGVQDVVDELFDLIRLGMQ